MRIATLTAALAALVLAAGSTTAADISGEYIETRTCDVYTGPCFANAESGLAGQEALMAWNIERGRFNGVALDGLKVAVATKADGTLGFGGGLELNIHEIRSVVYVDEAASAEQRDALVAFIRSHGGPAIGEIVRVEAQPIAVELDHVDMVGRLTVGDVASIETRKLGTGDCVCTNEMTFYPPLAAVENSEPAYTVEGNFAGRGLGTKWNNRSSRSSFLATFAY